jgi:hypothetical protein
MTDDSWRVEDDKAEREWRSGFVCRDGIPNLLLGDIWCSAPPDSRAQGYFCSSQNHVVQHNTTRNMCINKGSCLVLEHSLGGACYRYCPVGLENLFHTPEYIREYPATVLKARSFADNGQQSDEVWIRY